MHKNLFIFIILVVLMSNNTISDDKNIAKYGAPITYKRITPFKDVVKYPGKYKNKEILIEGYVDAVCQTKGCWMEVKNGNDKLRVEFKDYGFFVPYDSKGKKVKLQGKIERREVKPETLKHWMEEAGAPQHEIQKIKGKQKILIFTATGVEMEGGSEISPEQRKKIEGSNHKD